MTNFLNSPAPFTRRYALFLDVDGTLADFRDDPADVFLPPDLLDLLARLQHQLDGAVALISGRSSPDLTRVTAGRPLCCLGLHGLTQNAFCPGGVVLPEPSPEIAALREQSRDFCQRHPGVTVEDKALGLALHFRRAPHWQAAVQQFALDYVAQTSNLAQASGNSDFVVLQGKMVVEFRPARADKGAGVTRLLQHDPFKQRVPVFIGDDVTDEAAFAVVNDMQGVSIKCGAGPTCAQYRLPDVISVHRWLEEYSRYLAAQPEASSAARERSLSPDTRLRMER